MDTFVSRFSGVEIFFLVCAVVGGMFVLIRLIMQFFGLVGDADTDFSAGPGDVHHTDSDAGFKLLSVQGLTSFLMMFGLVGLALYRQSRMGTLISMIGAVIAGLASVWIIAKLFLLASRLQSSGTIPIDSTVGAVGEVYLRIPGKGTGRVLVKVRGSLREYDASSYDEKEISTGVPVRVVWVDGGVLVVERI
jgi:membrane protein implicated in regulation of membrane protease activity